MALSKEQIQEVKKQLHEQIQHLPLNKKDEAKKQIESMSPESLESLVQQQTQNSPFRLIISKKIESAIIKESPEAMAVLEISPISKGHTLIIPKNKIEEKIKIPQSIQKFVKKVIEKLSLALKPKEIKEIIDKKFGEIIIDLIPEYDKKISQNSERKKLEKSELEKIAKEINTPREKIEKKVEKIKIEDKKEKEKPQKLKRRIP